MLSGTHFILIIKEFILFVDYKYSNPSFEVKPLKQVTISQHKHHTERISINSLTIGLRFTTFCNDDSMQLLRQPFLKEMVYLFLRQRLNSVYMFSWRKRMKFFCGGSFRDETASCKFGLYVFTTKTYEIFLRRLFSRRNDVLQIRFICFHDENVWNFSTTALFTTKRHPANSVNAFSWRKRINFFRDDCFRDERASNKLNLCGFATKKTVFFSQQFFSWWKKAKKILFQFIS
jgi:hypothetical protein